MQSPEAVRQSERRSIAEGAYTAQRGTTERIALLENLVAMLLEKNEQLRQQLSAAADCRSL